MGELASQLPEIGIFALLVIGVVIQFAKWVIERRDKQAERAEIERYRKSRVPGSDPPPKFRDEEGTGRHDVRLMLEQDRTTQRILSLTEESAEILRRLAESHQQQGALMVRVVEMLERESATHDAILTSQREIAATLRAVAEELTDWRRRTRLASVDDRAVQG